MTVKELKLLLNNMGDDIEVMVWDNEYSKHYKPLCELKEIASYTAEGWCGEDYTQIIEAYEERYEDKKNYKKFKALIITCD